MTPDLVRERPVARGEADLADQGAACLANGDPAAACACLRRALHHGDQSPATWLNLALAEDALGRVRLARRIMRRVARRLPHWDEPMLRLAESLRAAGELADAEQAYRRVLDCSPNRPEALIALGGLLILRGDAAAARIHLVQACGLVPDRAEAWDALGLALMRTGDTPLALSTFIEAQRLAPAIADYALHGVEAATAAGVAEAELARLGLVSEDDPLNPVPLIASGVLLERLGKRAAAIDVLEVAAVLAPEAALPNTLLGGILARSSRLGEAAATLRRALALDPDSPGIRNDLAAVLMRMHRHAEARDLLLAIPPPQNTRSSVLCNLANATVCLGMQDAAVTLAERAIALEPDNVLPRRALCNTLPYQHGITGGRLLDALRDCGARLPRVAMPAFENDPDPDRRLTVGMLSGTLRTHPVGWLTVAGFETLDTDGFRLVGLAQNHSEGDPIARRFRAAAAEWIEVDALDDAALARRGRELGIDVLIDLGGYGDAARMPACANRLAPVQVKWVGMQNHSTGLAEMDWLITDRWETPAGFEPMYSERLLRLSDGYVCYSPPPYAPDCVPSPAAATGRITFGCFNNLAKITPLVIATWAAVLHRVPGSRLVLKTHQFSDAATCERLAADFAAHGIDVGRLEFRGSSPHRAFLAEYNQIDIVLDPFPYSGGLTTCEALWMGVPTVTMPGEIFASRHSVSHMSNAGLADWVADDEAGYIALAVAKAADIPALAALRAGLRARVKLSPLCDAARFGRSLGAALRHAWQGWCTDSSRSSTDATCRSSP